MLFTVLFTNVTAIAAKGRSLVEMRRQVQSCLDTFVQKAANWKICVNVTNVQAMVVPLRLKQILVLTWKTKLMINGFPIE